VPRLPRGRLPSHAVCVALVKCSISVEHTGMSFSWLRKIIDFAFFLPEFTVPLATRSTVVPKR
jgi:hypothetical protein